MVNPIKSKLSVKNVQITAAIIMSTVMLGVLPGCTAGMFGDLGQEPTAQIQGETYKPISVDSIIVNDMVPYGGDTASPAAVKKYENSMEGKMVATIKSTASGYGDLFEKNMAKIKKKAAKIGANLLIVTSKTGLGSGGLFATIEGVKTMEVKVDAYHIAETEKYHVSK